LREGEQPLRKKGQGRLIHVSDFINEEDGQLVLLDETSHIIRDARKVIYPGSNVDPWWDTDQLLVQVKSAIEIFEAAHPDCQALFVFEQSSAHASLPPDALKAFTTNKSNGGVQCKQKKYCHSSVKSRPSIPWSPSGNDHTTRGGKKFERLP
jgi:hypothetical protein